MNETKTIAKFVENTTYDDLPIEVVNLIRIYALDDLACGLVGAYQPWSRMVADLVYATKSAPECSIFGHNWRACPSSASLVNGTMIGGFEADHAYLPGSAHPSGAVFPALMATAEKFHKNGRDFLVAMVLGYEVLCRIGLAATRAVEDERGFHGPATNAVFGSAVGVSKLLGLDKHRITHALGIAGSHAGGLMEFANEGAMVKRLHLGRGTQTGLESAFLAQKGFTGPSTVLEGTRGFLNVYSPSPQVDRLVQDLGQTWLLKDLVIKPYACYGQHQSIIEGFRKFLTLHPVDPETIQRIVVSGSKRMMEHHDDHEPTTIMGAQYNLPFSLAVAVTRDIANPLVFDQELLSDIPTRLLARKIECLIDQDRFGQSAGDPRAEISIEINDERHIIQVDGFRGSPTNPFTWNDVSTKFSTYAEPVIGKNKSRQTIDLVKSMEDIPDMTSVFALMRSGKHS